ncbi:LPXTG cell wall anchor domain-containing protein [Catenuloplanes atrovinosus]|nr:LPXTG cell wall anchor domain-containing protein [Catenuloplanes atrovinosus]
MRWKVSAGVLVALAFMIPAAPATAHAAQPGLDAACQTVERVVYKDFRQIVTIDLDAATDVDVRVLANQILAEAKTESLPVVSRVLQERLDGTPESLRQFLKTELRQAWTTDLRISVGRSLTGAGTNVKAAGQDVLNKGTVDGYLAYLNEGLYAARALDCASQPTPTPTATPTGTPSATPGATPGGTATAAPTATSSASPVAGGEGGGGLPVTGADTGTVAAIGAAILLLGGVAYLIGRRRRSRFVA